MLLIHTRIYTVFTVLFIILQTTLSSDYYDQPDYIDKHENGQESSAPATEKPLQNSAITDAELR